MLIFQKLKRQSFIIQPNINIHSIMNQTQTVRSAINIFILVAVGVSLIQELTNLNHKQTVPQMPTSEGQSPTTPQPTGPKLQGIRIQSSESFQAPLKQLLSKKQLNVEIIQYQFQGNDYWVNMLANWGHMAIIFYFMSKHKNQTDGSKKKQIMIMGAVAVVGWFYLAPKMKPQRFAIEVKGVKVYEKDYYVEEEVANVIDENEFLIDEMQEESGKVENGEAKVDAWAQRKQQQPSANEQNIVSDEEVVNDDELEF